MADNRELQHLPDLHGSALVISDARSELIARGRKDASHVLIYESQPECLALVRRHGKMGVIDKAGKLVVDPIYQMILPASCKMMAFSTSAVRCDDSTSWYFDRMVLGRELTENHFGYGNDPHDCLRLDHGIEGGLWGYFDSCGKIAIPPQFQSARPFREELAAIFLEGKWGFVLPDGKLAVDPQFEGAGDFKDGKSVVRINRKCGMIDAFGKFLIQPVFDFLWSFCDGLACARQGQTFGFINTSGEFQIAPVFLEATDFRDGLARVLTQDGHYAYIDKTGRIVFQSENPFERLPSFHDGVCLVKKDGYEELAPCDLAAALTLPLFQDTPFEAPKWLPDYGYFVDKTGKQITDRLMMRAFSDFSEGLGAVGVPTRLGGTPNKDSRRMYRFGYLNNCGQFEIEPKFREAHPFREGRAIVLTEDEKWRIIDKHGVFVDAPEFGEDELAEYHEGLARIDIGGKYGYINLDGAVVIDAEFEGAGAFVNGIVQVREGGKVGFIDKSGNAISPCEYDSATDFHRVRR